MSITEDVNNNNNGGTGRHNQWFLCASCTTIALVAMTKSYDTDLGNQSRSMKWAVSGISLALVFSTVGVFASCLLKEKFVNQPYEGITAFLTCGFWSSVIAEVMDPSNGYALSGSGITNANLYFFSWGGVIVSFIILISYVKEQNKTVGSTTSTSTKLYNDTPSIWACLCMTSFITMVSASRLFANVNCSNQSWNRGIPEYCSRSAWGVALGLISGVICIVWPTCTFLISRNDTEFLEAVISILTFTLWIFGVTYITFGGANAPGAPIGNLYFFTWGSFMLSVYLAMNGLKIYLNPKKGSTESNNRTLPTTAQQTTQ